MLRRCSRSSWKRPRRRHGKQKSLNGIRKSERIMQSSLDILAMKMKKSKQCYRNSKIKRNDLRVVYRGLRIISKAKTQISRIIN